MAYKVKLSSNITIAGLVLLLLFFADLKFQQYYNQKEIAKQEQSLQQQSDALQKKNQDLSQSLQYLNSSGFKEQVARQQLDLKKAGEQVYTFADAPQTNPQTPMQSTPGNFQKWWNYFFSN